MTIQEVKEAFFTIWPVVKMVGIEEWLRRFYSGFYNDSDSFVLYLAGYISSFQDTDKDPGFDVFKAWKLAKTAPLIDDLSNRGFFDRPVKRIVKGVSKVA